MPVVQTFQRTLTKKSVTMLAKKCLEAIQIIAGYTVKFKCNFVLMSHYQIAFVAIIYTIFMKI